MALIADTNPDHNHCPKKPTQRNMGDSIEIVSLFISDVIEDMIEIDTLTSPIESVIFLISSRDISISCCILSRDFHVDRYFFIISNRWLKD